MTKEKIEKATVKIDLTVIKSKDELILRKQLAEGTLPNGTNFRLSDSGNYFIVEHKINKNKTIIYSFFKEELFMELSKSVLIKKPIFIEKK